MKSKRKIVFIAVLTCILAICMVLAACKHSHSFSDKWLSDGNEHWQECQSCKEICNKAKHTVDQNSWEVIKQPTDSQPGSKRGECSVCKAVVTEEIAILSHTHTTDKGYEYNSTSHFKRCSSCNEVYAIEAHEITSWIIDKEPTADTKGLKHGLCEICNHAIEQSIPELDHNHTPYAYWESDDDFHWIKCSLCDEDLEDTKDTHTKTWVTQTPATTTSAGLEREECSVCERVFSTREIPKLSGSSRTADFYAINDFHGSVGLMSSVGGYLKERKNSNPNTLLINSGDMFQGSMESNSNYGKLLTDCMDEVGFDAFVYGNHEFDWGLNKLENLANNSNVPFLGANIYHWDAATKTWGTFASELAKKYTITTLDNGLKVGIIGVIGEKQITSISSNLVQTIGFRETVPIIKQLALELRNEQQCDVVVVSAHASPRGLVGEPEGNNYPEEPSSAYGLEKYVNAVFCAHSHREQNFIVDGLTFIQGGSYGSFVSHVSLDVDTDGSVSCSVHENIMYSSSWPNLAQVDTLINNSNEKIKEERNQVLIPNLSYSLSNNPAMARLVSRSIAEYAKNQEYDITLAMVNTARKTLSYGQVTYSDLYESIPFDNVVYIAKVKGSEIINEVAHNVNYWRSSGEAIESDKWYTIAVIDYLLFHQNSSRDYDYFPSAFESGFTPVALTNENYDVYNYRLITRDYLLANAINASDYTYNNSNTDTSLLQTEVTLDYETVGDWTVGGGGVTPTPTPTPTPEHCGTYEDPYSVADAILVGAEYTVGSAAPKIYVRGIVSDVSGIKQSNTTGDLGNFTVIDESGATIKIYYVTKTQSGNNWSSTEDLKVGDVLVMYIGSYVYNGTAQLGYGYCVVINGEPLS